MIWALVFIVKAFKSTFNATNLLTVTSKNQCILITYSHMKQKNLTVIANQKSSIFEKRKYTRTSFNSTCFFELTPRFTDIQRDLTDTVFRMQFKSSHTLRKIHQKDDFGPK